MGDENSESYGKIYEYDEELNSKHSSIIFDEQLENVFLYTGEDSLTKSEQIQYSLLESNLIVKFQNVFLMI